MEKIKVIIADDHPLMRQGIKQIIELEPDIQVIGQASNGEEAIKLIADLSPDICLIDINMPVLNGIQTLEKLRELKYKNKVIVLTIHNDKDYLKKTIQLGALGYVLKDSESEVLIKAIRSVNKGETFIPSSLATELIKGYDIVSKVDDDTELTDREVEVLRLIADGQSNKEIGAQLYISEKTVKNHISNIFRKLNISDRTQAAIYAIKSGIKK